MRNCARSHFTYTIVRYPITDFRDEDTGLQPIQLFNGVLLVVITMIKSHCLIYVAPQFEDVQRRVALIISGKVVAGYSLWMSLSVS